MGTYLSNVENQPTTTGKVVAGLATETSQPPANEEQATIEEFIKDTTLSDDVGLSNTPGRSKQPTFGSVLQEISPLPSRADNGIISKQGKQKKM